MIAKLDNRYLFAVPLYYKKGPDIMANLQALQVKLEKLDQGTLSETVRMLTGRGSLRRNAIIQNFMRREETYSVANTLRRFQNRCYRLNAVGIP